MLTMDVFKDDAFSAIEMSAPLDKVSYHPQYLSNLPGLYEVDNVRTTDVFIEERGNTPALILTSPRGTPPNQKGGDRRKVRSFATDRIALSSRITADQLQNIRAYGSTTELQSLQVEIARRQMTMMKDFELTREHYLLGLVQGQFIDADGSVIRDWATEWGQSLPAEIDFDLDNASPAQGALRKKCNTVRRGVLQALEGMGGANVQIHALCGDAFYDDLVTHKEVYQTFLNWQAAQDLRNSHGGAFSAFTFGEITWHNYRGTDSAETGKSVGIAPDKCHFFPVNAGIFRMAYSPAETFDFVNTPGQEMYSWMVTDQKRNAWADVEMYSYPLPVCVMPKALFSARRT